MKFMLDKSGLALLLSFSAIYRNSVVSIDASVTWRRPQEVKISRHKQTRRSTTISSRVRTQMDPFFQKRIAKNNRNNSDCPTTL
jgi:hypothetical protein